MKIFKKIENKKLKLIIKKFEVKKKKVKIFVNKKFNYKKKKKIFFIFLIFLLL